MRRMAMSLRSVYSAKAASIVETGVSDAGSITSVTLTGEPWRVVEDSLESTTRKFFLPLAST
jgi:hypothetical protein